MKRLLWILIALVACAIGFLGLWSLVGRQTEPTFTLGRVLPPGKIQPQVSATWDRAYLLAPDGSLWAWGGTQFGQVDVQNPGVSEIPRRVGTDSDWVKFAASWNHVLAIKADGSLWGWGNNSSGELATDPLKSVTSPIRIGIDHDWKEVSVGAAHSLALKTNGSLWAWGKNTEGQVGDGSRTNQFEVTEILPGSHWKAISAGSFNSYALRADGSIWGWGLDPLTGGANHDFEPRQIGLNTNWVGISAGDYHLIALQRDGTIWLHGQNAHVAASRAASTSATGLVPIGDDHDWREIYSGANHEILRKSDGTWWTCGQNACGNVSCDSPQKMDLAFEPWAFSASGSTGILLAKDGVLWTWGDRLGSRQPRNLLKEAFYLLRKLMQGQKGTSSDPSPIVDKEPHKIWELPATTEQPADESQPR
jgi:alpha-tubulin suppressor-like RCC1 family protein